MTALVAFAAVVLTFGGQGLGLVVAAFALPAVGLSIVNLAHGFAGSFELHND